MSMIVDSVYCAVFLRIVTYMYCVFRDYYGRTLSDASMFILPMFFIFFFMTALVGQTAERIFTKLSHVVDIRCYLRTY